MTEIQLYTVREVAEFLRVSEMTIYRIMKRGELHAVRIRHQYRIRHKDLERYLKENTVG